MKILHVITRSEWGGAQKIVFQLAREQERRGYHVTVMCGENGRLVRELKTSGIKVSLNPHLQRGLGLHDLQAGFSIDQELREGYDLVHAHSSKAGVLVRMIAPARRVPVCFTVHGFGISPEHSQWQQKAYHRVERFCAGRTDALVFVNEADRKLAGENGWLARAGLTVVIPNGIEITREGEKTDGTAWDQASARRALGIPAGAFVVGNLARVAWIKDPEFWVRTAQHFLMECPDSNFIWFGGGENLSHWHHYLAQTGLGDKICFAGETEKITMALKGLDVMFLSSRSEGMPLAILEGMSRKKPIVAPALPGLKLLLSDCGLLYEPGNIDEAVSALHHFRDGAFRRRFGDSGFRKCVNQYSVANMISSYEEVYKHITGGE